MCARGLVIYERKNNFDLELLSDLLIDYNQKSVILVPDKDIAVLISDTELHQIDVSDPRNPIVLSKI